MGTHETSGWGRKSQDSAEAGIRPVEPPEPAQLPFLDRPVGYATVRWLVVVCGMILGAVVTAVVFSALVDDPIGFLTLDAAFVGALIGGLATWLGLHLFTSLGSRNAKSS